MKKLILLFAIFSVITLNAQETEKPVSKNEVKLNLGYLLLGLPELSYERILNDDSSVGMSVAFSIDSDVDINYMLTPYYRFFFGKKPSAGFFIEANGAVFSEEYYSKNEVGAGLGVALGGKFISKNNWTGELLLGAGRTLANSKNTSEAYPRIGVTIGKRF